MLPLYDALPPSFRSAEPPLPNLALKPVPLELSFSFPPLALDVVLRAPALGSFLQIPGGFES